MFCAHKIWRIVFLLPVVLLYLAIPILAADYAPDEILVHFKPGVSEASIAKLHASQRSKLMEKFGKRSFHRLKLPKGMSVEQAVAAYRKNPSVEYAGPNHFLHLDLYPNDEHFDWQWGLDCQTTPRHDIHATEAWNTTTGGNIIIAVLDTGVWAQHEDLYVSGPNPKVLQGYNTVSNNTDTSDYNGHGTLVASIAAASTNNYIGMAGVAWNARILPVKVMEGEQGLESDAAEGVWWAVDHGAKIINMSLGSYIDEPVLEQAIDDAWAAGCLIVCSSGNDDLNTMHYPSAYDHALAVGGTNDQDQRWVYDDPWFGEHYGSNYGYWLDVMAPCDMILGAYIEDDWLFGLGWYTIASGTSAASPFVSGIAALIWSQHPTWTNQQIFQQIVATCDNLGPPGWDIETGAGRVNAHLAVTTSTASPATIRELKTLPNGTWVNLSGRVVTCKPGRLTDRIYIEDEDRASGILVYGAVSPPTMDEGSRVDVSGFLGEVNGERAITNPLFGTVTPGTALFPMAMQSRHVGGKQLGAFQQGVDKGLGINNLGMLIRCGGIVEYSDFGHFYIDDGCGFKDGSGHTGLRVAWGGTKPDEGSMVVVTGISGCEIPEGTSLRVRTLRVRKLDDIWPPIAP